MLFRSNFRMEQLGKPVGRDGGPAHDSPEGEEAQPDAFVTCSTRRGPWPLIRKRGSRGRFVRCGAGAGLPAQLPFRVTLVNSMSVSGHTSQGNVWENLMRWIALLGLLLSFGAPAAEPAKKMYRCGNVFQERPCEGPKAAPKAEAPKQDGPSQAALESRKKIQIGRAHV